MTLHDVLRRENNNLDLFRLIAAYLVIIGHAYALAPQVGQQDPILRILGFDYSGSLAVKLFFFLSGLVVVNSLLDKRDVAQFLVARLYRIWPGLVFVLCAWAFVLGPIWTTLSLGSYFQDRDTYLYVLKSLVMNIRYDLPGVFDGNVNTAVNGSLWTIPSEVFAYVTVAALFALGALRHRMAVAGIALAILVDAMAQNRFIFSWLNGDPNMMPLAPCFAFGAVLAAFKHDIRLGKGAVVALWALYGLFRDAPFAIWLFYAALFCTVVWLAGLPALLRLRLRADISYGVYLWGFPVQQVFAESWPQAGPLVNQMVSLPVATVAGVISWYLVEKRFIAIGRNVQRRMKKTDSA